MDLVKSNNNTILRLTALWALAESGLGGWMHALRLPFTGIFVGGFAVVLISLIAYFSQGSFRQVWKATILVLLVKFAVSPQSPFQAYIAVAFQGLIGAALFSLISYRPVASLLFAVLAMLESAVQKLIFMTLIFGKSLWEALNSFFQAIAKDFSLPGHTSFSFWIIALYVGIYIIWGILLGLWIIGLPKRLDAGAKTVYAHLENIRGITPARPVPKRNRIWMLIGILLFIIIVFVYNGTADSGIMSKTVYTIIRTLAVIMLLLYVVNPLTQWLMQQWLARSSNKRKEEVSAVMNLLPGMRSNIKPAYAIARCQYSGLRRYTGFIYVLIILSLELNNEPA